MAKTTRAWKVQAASDRKEKAGEKAAEDSRRSLRIQIGIKESEGPTSLDPKLAPVLWFHNNYDQCVEESDDEDGEASGDDEEVSDEDEFGETSDEDESIEETDDDGISDDDDDDNNDDDEEEEKSNEVNDTLLLYSISSQQLLANSGLDDLKDHFYWITPQGWLLMLHRDSHEIFLRNPFTSQRINLPFDQDRFLRKNYIRCLLSHKPTDSNCVVLILSLHDTVIWYCRPGGMQWFKHEYQARRFFRHRGTVIENMSLITAVGGKFCTVFPSTVVTLDFSPNPTFDIVAVTSVQNSVYKFMEIYLLESRGELFCLYFYPPVSCPNKTVEISVYKLDILTTAWVKVDTLGDRAFFIDTREDYGTSVNAKEACLQENCIYFSRHKDKGLYVYSMERGTTAAINPSTDLVDDVAAQILMPAS
uniref:KIB1-4 beta-propeller domain-containing protein n=1 Tax=Oryza nivara TaxID=4536 RepID=A0A0E0J0U9_ORYNI